MVTRLLVSTVLAFLCVTTLVMLGSRFLIEVDVATPIPDVEVNFEQDLIISDFSTPNSDSDLNNPITIFLDQPLKGREKRSGELQKYQELLTEIEKIVSGYECIVIESSWATIPSIDEIQQRNELKLSLWNTYLSKQGSSCIENNWSGIDTWGTRYLLVRDGVVAFYSIYPPEASLNSEPSAIKGENIDVSLGVLDRTESLTQSTEYAVEVRFDAPGIVNRRTTVKI